ncbi:UPF0489 family protein [Proteocatella sphenisci]|uniref:UPF0489 family protein n=1 Tax=Proteocatella sphenisci TaxID=181070 RepID=UPI0004B629C8|nr:UPF0489 family protein [Proteocatella sphenisci]
MKAYGDKFYIDIPISNNKFSFEKRKFKKIVIPNIIEGLIKEVKKGDEFSFIEIDENNNEIKCLGVKNMILQKQEDKKMYIFDNHNHTFYFTYEHYKENKIKFDFIHIDQHKDLREPDLYFEEYIQLVRRSYDAFRDEMNKIGIKSEKIIKEEFDRKDNDTTLAFLYTNTTLNVGNFIKPLMNMGIINDFYCVDSQYSLDEIDKYNISNNYILDLDLDFFSNEMDYICKLEKIKIIKKLIKNASIVLIATSPYFIEFNKCKDIIDVLMD